MWASLERLATAFPATACIWLLFLVAVAHFGVICDPGPSHVMAMTAICRPLQSQGHRATLSGLTPQRLYATVQRVLGHSQYNAAAEQMKLWLARTRGASEAVEIIEKVVQTRRPVVAAQLHSPGR